MHQVIRKNVGGFNPSILHSTLKALTFIGDFDSAVVKSVEDELIYKIMNRYEAENAQRQPPKSLHEVEVHSTSEGMVREFVCTLVDDVSTGVEIAAATESVLGSFKVRARLIQSAAINDVIGLIRALLVALTSSQSHASIQSSQFCSDISASLNKLAKTTVRNLPLIMIDRWS